MLDVGGAASAGIRPLVDAGPLVLARRAREPRDQVDVQVGNAIADHGGVDVLGAGDVLESPAGDGGPPAHGSRFGVGQVSETGGVPLWLNEQVPEVLTSDPVP